MTTKSLIALGFLTLALSSPTRLGVAATAAEAQPLNIGDDPPAYSPKRWLQGEAVTEFQKGTTYLLEFWATWCGPCTAQIPHLNDLHLKYKDRGLVVVGQNVWEQKPSDAEAFVTRMGLRMSYRIALDDGSRDGTVARTWLQASGQQGIPSAIIVGPDRKIAWIGYGMDLRESVIEAIMAGSHDSSRAAAQLAARRRFEQESDTARSERDWDRLLRVQEEYQKTLSDEDWNGLAGLSCAFGRMDALVGRKEPGAAARFADELGKRHPKAIELNASLAIYIAAENSFDGAALKIAGGLADLAMEASKGRSMEALTAKTQVLVRSDRRAEAVSMLEKAQAAVTADVDRESLNTMLAVTRFDLHLQRKDSAGAYRIARGLLETNRDEPFLLNDCAWKILTDAGLSPRDFVLAETLARRANEATEDSVPMIQDTLALALFGAGKKDEAIAVQEKALASVAENPVMKEQFAKRLESYRAGKWPTDLK